MPDEEIVEPAVLLSSVWSDGSHAYELRLLGVGYSTFVPMLLSVSRARSANDDADEALRYQRSLR